ncbi:hypothetical protein LA080_006512 [Diaporthe eres]|nr:hypothetical protein LA080_006512 [Diaporthe eres]
MVLYNAAQTKQQHPRSAEFPPHPHTSEQGREGLRIPVGLGHHFENNVVNGNARQIQGDVVANLEGNPGHRNPVHKFIGNQAHDYGTQIQGIVGAQVVDRVLDDGASRKNERAAAGKANGASS